MRVRVRVRACACVCVCVRALTYLVFLDFFIFSVLLSVPASFPHLVFSIVPFPTPSFLPFYDFLCLPSLSLVFSFLEPFSECCYIHYRESKKKTRRTNEIGKRKKKRKGFFSPLLSVFFPACFWVWMCHYSRESAYGDSPMSVLPPPWFVESLSACRRVTIGSRTLKKKEKKGRKKRKKKKGIFAGFELGTYLWGDPKICFALTWHEK